MEKATLVCSIEKVLYKNENGISRLETNILEIPKYLFPRMEILKATLETRITEYHIIIKTYVLVRSNTGKFYYVPFYLRNISYNDNMEELLKEDLINEVHKFQHFNSLYTDEQIKKYLDLKLGI